MVDRLRDNGIIFRDYPSEYEAFATMSPAKMSTPYVPVNQEVARPFLKWAGGKGQLLGQIRRHLPAELKAGKISKYVEPFIGGGAVFFLIANEYAVNQVYISDRNADLVLAYRTVKEHVESLIRRLEDIEQKFIRLPPNLRKEYFYETRRLFNKKRRTSGRSEECRHAELHVARLIFLNRTCFNGLYRVNSSGDFNVPFGNYPNPRICDAENLRSVSRSLENAVINCGDFADCESFVDDRTFVYFDPPYRPISRTANFNSYARSPFDDNEQKRLASFFQELDRTGAKLMLSNSDPKNEDPHDTFFTDLYPVFGIHEVNASRRINSNGSKRGEITELLITNYGRGGIDGG